MEEPSVSVDIDSDIDEENSELVVANETNLAEQRLVDNDKTHVANFKTWLSSLDGGSREKSTADVYGNAALCILSNLGGISELHKCKDLGINGGYFEFLLGSGMKPGTVKAFLHGLKAFADFLEWREDIHLVSPRVLTTMRQCADRWLKTVAKAGKTRHQQFRYEESQRIDKLITSIPHLLTTRRAKQAKILLLSDETNITVEQFQDSRDIIILLILLSSGHRTGVIINATRNEFSDAPMPDHGKQTIFVSNHKTSSTYGPLPIVLDVELSNMLQSHIRQRVSVTGDSTVLFATPSGRKMTSNDVCRGLQRVTETELITPTRIRKVVATKLLGEDLSSSVMNDISSVMGHLPITQRTYYDYRNRVKIATNVHSQIINAMGLETDRQTLTDTESGNTSNLDNPAQIINTVGIETDSETLTNGESGNHDILDTPAQVQQNSQPSTSQGTIHNPLLQLTSQPVDRHIDSLACRRQNHGRRAGFSNSELKCIDKIFKHHRGKSLLFSKIRELLGLDDEGKIILGKYKTIQLRDKVKSMKS